MKNIDWKSNEKEHAKLFQMVGISSTNKYIISKLREDTNFLVRTYSSSDRYYFNSVELAKEWCEAFDSKNKN